MMQPPRMSAAEMFLPIPCLRNHAAGGSPEDGAACPGLGPKQPEMETDVRAHLICDPCQTGIAGGILSGTPPRGCDYLKVQVPVEPIVRTLHWPDSSTLLKESARAWVIANSDPIYPV